MYINLILSSCHLAKFGTVYWLRTTSKFSRKKAPLKRRQGATFRRCCIYGSVRNRRFRQLLTSVYRINTKSYRNPLRFSVVYFLLNNCCDFLAVKPFSFNFTFEWSAHEFDPSIEVKVLANHLY